MYPSNTEWGRVQEVLDRKCKAAKHCHMKGDVAFMIRYSEIPLGGKEFKKNKNNEYKCPLFIKMQFELSDIRVETV